MMDLDEKFKALKTDNAPGQEVLHDAGDISSGTHGGKPDGVFVDFSHGDVNAFPPAPGSDAAWKTGYDRGAKQAYTEYRGAAEIRHELAVRLGKFTGRPISAESELIITPGTQGALFLALGVTVTTGTKVSIIIPDYFANRKIVVFLGGEVVPVPLNYRDSESKMGIDITRLEDSFKNGTEVFVFSTPNNPTGLVYSGNTINKIAALAAEYNVTLIVDELYSRMLYSGEEYTHLYSCDVTPENLITIIGPSKTESLSGFRLGAAFGTPKLIERMERLQAIVSLRASGYNQAVLKTWFQEPKDWLENRIRAHEAIRDELLRIFRGANIQAVKPQAGSYLYPQLPPLSVDLHTFVRLLRYEANVIVTPGTEFDPDCKDSIRLNFSQDYDSAVAAAKRIVKMVDIYKL
jgi:aspartate/methionine/tyrosine aminotransferase